LVAPESVNAVVGGVIALFLRDIADQSVFVLLFHAVLSIIVGVVFTLPVLRAALFFVLPQVCVLIVRQLVDAGGHNLLGVELFLYLVVWVLTAGGIYAGRGLQKRRKRKRDH
jgi:hypothetical protein